MRALSFCLLGLLAVSPDFALAQMKLPGKTAPGASETRYFTSLDGLMDGNADVEQYATQVEGFLSTWLPRLRSETRSYVTVAFGCTGGRHRSVYLAERLAGYFRDAGWDEVATHHRELD